MSGKNISINVTLSGGADRSYAVHIGSGLLERARDFLSGGGAGRKIFVLYDRAVQAHADKILKAFPDARAYAVEGGEKTKSFAAYEEVSGWLLANHVDRSSLLFVVGGGVAGDLGGYVAATILRGIDFVQVPTTLLAQVDSSVGGKTGINTPHGKNLVGAFYQPVAVLCDTDTLKTLPERELKAGYAEIVKYGILGSNDFYDWLEEHGGAVLALDDAALAHAVETSCSMKAAIVAGDERERAGGARALLNLGHTFAHALEAAAGYDGRLLHGEAVSIGLVLALRLSAQAGFCSAEEALRVETHLKKCGLKTEIADITPALPHSADEIIALMAGDKKARDGAIGFILARSIGEVFQSYDVDMELVRLVVLESTGRIKA
ncbi:MAG: 3-dehydroquinate synthase [Micavibrio sp.]